MEVKRVHDNLFGKYGMMHWHRCHRCQCVRPYVERFTCVIGNKVGAHGVLYIYIYIRIMPLRLINQLLFENFTYSCMSFNWNPPT